jgi:hypothetical protein
VITKEAIIAALKLAKILLERSQTSPTGYGYVQTWDARTVGLVEGDPSRWNLTPLGRLILSAELDMTEKTQQEFYQR